jgi:hypothetical protein
MEHLALGRLEFEHITLQLPGDPAVRIMIFTPNPATRTKLERLLEPVTSR